MNRSPFEPDPEVPAPPFVELESPDLLFSGLQWLFVPVRLGLQVVFGGLMFALLLPLLLPFWLVGRVVLLLRRLWR